jgi:hypothetical protein
MSSARCSGSPRLKAFGRQTSSACCSRPPKCGSVRRTVAPPLHTRWSSVDGIDFGHDQRAAEMRLPTVSKTNTTLPHHIIV